MTWQLTHARGSGLRYDRPCPYQNVYPPAPPATPTATHASAGRAASAKVPRRRRKFVAVGIVVGAGVVAAGPGLNRPAPRPLHSRRIRAAIQCWQETVRKWPTSPAGSRPPPSTTPTA